MRPIFKVQDIKNRIKLNVINAEVSSHKMTRMLMPGDISSLFRPQQEERKSKVVGLLFANPDVPFVKNEILHSLDYFHHLTSTHLDVFCAGYFTDLISQEYTDRRLINVGTTPWEFSTIGQIELENEIENISLWKRSGETTLLLFEVYYSSGQVDLKFDYSLDLNLEQMLRDKAITSVRSFINSLVANLKNHSSTWSASDNYGKSLLKDYLRGSILNLLPTNLKESYEKAEHFAVKNLSKGQA